MEEEVEKVEMHRHKSAGSDVLQTLTPDWLNQAPCRHVTVVLHTTPPRYTTLSHNRGPYVVL